MNLNLTSRIVLFFVGLASALLIAVGGLSYRSGSESLKAAAVSEMLALGVEKEAALNAWIEERLDDIKQIASFVDVVGKAADLIAAAPASDEARSARAILQEELKPHLAAPLSAYLELFVMEPVGGKVLVSTSPSEEGKSKLGHPYFENGKTDLYLQLPYFSTDVNRAGMTAGVPLRAPDGRVVAVLGARLDLDVLDSIARRWTGLQATVDSYVINAGQFPVTQPRFISEPAVLRRKLETEAVRLCAARQSGVILAPDYRGVLSIAVYRWNAKHQLGLIVKIDQSEALAPARTFGRSVVLISTLALLAMAGLSFALADTITRPLRALRDRVRRFDNPNSGDVYPKVSGDEVCLLSREFDRMAERVAEGAAKFVASNKALQEENAVRKQAETDLRSAHAQLAQMIEHSPAVTYRLKVEGEDIIPMMASANVERLLGFPVAETLTNGWWLGQLHPEDRDRAIAIVGETLKNGASHSDYRLRHKEGGYRWIDDNRRLFRDPSGRATEMIGVWMDITKRKQAEASQLAEEERYIRQRTALISFTGGGYHPGEGLADALRRLTETSAKTLDVARVSIWRYKHDRTAIQCMDLYDLAADRHTEGMELSTLDYPGYFRALAGADVIAADDAHRDARTCEFLENYFRPLGITSMLDAPIRVGGAEEGVLCHEHVGPPRRWTSDETSFAVAMANLVSLALETSERKRVEADLRWKTALLEAQVNSAIDGILVVDDHGRQLIKNERFNKVWKIPRHIAEDTDDRKALEFATSQAKNPRQFREKVDYLYSHREEISHDEIELIDGTTLERYSGPVRAKEGQFYGRIWVFHDITDRKRAEAAIQDLHKQLVDAAREAGMAEIATNVLHNVGNVLNSVNVSTDLVVENVESSRAPNLAKVAALLKEHDCDLGNFITNDPRGRKVPVYLAQLSEELIADRAALLRELGSFRKNVEHIKEIVAMQQTYATFGGVKEIINVVNLVEDSLRINEVAFTRDGVEVIRIFENVPPINAEKHKILQILVNLLRNAKHACLESNRADKAVTLRVADGEGRIKISVSDNGVGIPPENLARIFHHGFTTKKDGHGFGLHSSALAAKDMGGSLAAHSDGPGEGATFILDLPCPTQEFAHG